MIAHREHDCSIADQLPNLKPYEEYKTGMMYKDSQLIQFLTIDIGEWIYRNLDIYDMLWKIHLILSGLATLAANHNLNLMECFKLIEI